MSANSRWKYDSESGLIVPSRERRIQPIYGRALEGANHQTLLMGGGSPSDPNFNDVALLLPLHDGHGSVVFTDYSPRVKTMTKSGTGSVSNIVTQFGNNSYLQSNVGDYLGTPDNTDFQMGSGALSLELFVHFTSVSAVAYILTKQVSTGYTPWQISATAANKIMFVSYDNAGTPALRVNLLSTTTITTGVSYFIQVIRSTGNRWDLCINGTSEANVTPAAYSVYTDTAKVLIGGDDTVGAYILRGYVNTLRITKAVARAIAVPVAQWPQQ